MLTSRYMPSVKNLPSIMGRIVEGAPPPKFTSTHLKSLGFTSSNDHSVIALLKDLGFLAADGTPTDRYKEYRDRSRSKAVLGQAIKEAYSDLFQVSENPTEADREKIEGKFKSVHGGTDRVAQEQAKTFFAVLALADVKAAPAPAAVIAAKPSEVEIPTAPTAPVQAPAFSPTISMLGGLRYNIEIHLPASKDPEVFNAIFKSLKAHLLDD